MRRNPRITSGCTAALILLVLVIVPSSGAAISYQISENGTAFHAGAEITGERFDFVQSGMLGERVPMAVTNVSVTQNGTAISYTTDREGVRFPPGNYSVGFDGKVSGNAFQTVYSEPQQVTVRLPERFRVDNPLLTSLQPSGATVIREGNLTEIRWEKARYIDIRFYDQGQENLLGIFGQFWLIIAVMLLLPFILSREH